MVYRFPDVTAPVVSECYFVVAFVRVSNSEHAHVYFFILTYIQPDFRYCKIASKWCRFLFFIFTNKKLLIYKTRVWMNSGHISENMGKAAKI